MRRGVFCFALLVFLSSCGLHLPVGVEDAEGAAGGSIAVMVENFLPQVQRTIAPGHISTTELQNQYELRLTGTNGFQSLQAQTLTLVNGRATLPNIPVGLWELTLTAYNRTGNVETLRGRASVSVTALEVSPASFTLKPLLTGNGTVNVQFTLPQGMVKRLDPPNNANKQVAVALYYDEVDAEVPGTKQTFTMTAGGTITYTANGRQVPEGQYTIKLSATYTVNNATTLFQNATYDTGYEDVLYVESNRVSSATVAIPEARTAMGFPGNPHRIDKATESGSSKTANFGTATSFSPYGETLWMYAGNWDSTGGNSDSNGNEVLVVDWDPVYNADYYELELLVHPFTRYNSSAPASNGKFSKVVTTDTDWETLKNTSFSYGGQTKKPSFLRFSGGVGSNDYYKTAYYTINCNTNSQFLACADKPLARSLFPNKGAAAGKVNANYSLLQTQDAFDTYTVWNYGGTSRGKVGLEGDCSVLGILLPAYAPRMSVVCRVRGVNEFGTSDWVYWKGGIW